MILSEFAGAAQSLNGSIVVNPWDSQQVADAIYEAVTTSPETRQENQKKLFKVQITVLMTHFNDGANKDYALISYSTSRNTPRRTGVPRS